MFKIDSKELQKFYIAYFCRPGDPSGINYWISDSDKSLTLKDISCELSRQDEYAKCIANDKSFESQINKIYINLFGRKADFHSLNHWLKMVENHHYKISDIVYDLLYLFDQTGIVDSQQIEKDLNILEKKIHASEIFTKEISRNITLINLYQPDSISPWITGNSLKKASHFLNNVKEHYVSIQEVKNTINSLSDSSIDLTQPAIKMKNISLSIPIYSLEKRSITKSLADTVINITGGKLDHTKTGTNIIALNNINLTIMKGERIGLIGHNGSGKSSFLRLISGIYVPTSGEVEVSVYVYPMLQKTFLTSTELTGVDACKAHYLLHNHSLNGFETFLSQIIEFSGLGSFISLPIKTYSEGMSARLIFSILTSSSNDCLAIDEGFGTGDADFCDRAEERMQEFMASAATLFLASHSEELLKQFCNRGLVFRQGQIVYDGPLDAALNYYHTHDYYSENVIR